MPINSDHEIQHPAVKMINISRISASLLAVGCVFSTMPAFSMAAPANATISDPGWPSDTNFTLSELNVALSPEDEGKLSRLTLHALVDIPPITMSSDTVLSKDHATIKTEIITDNISKGSEVWKATYESLVLFVAGASAPIYVKAKYNAYYIKEKN
ncbi:MAG: hypothetical protein M1820_003275 [Bogoriella megaspora]|nr:MAG: hypothetical protein M1820_003275 [Bogoriella megaspora]